MQPPSAVTSPGAIVSRPWAAALGSIALLGAIFFTTYGFANWAASVRSGVGSVVFAWERAIPFWSWTILPYWSIDLLYGLSLLICATRAELATQVKRLLAAQAISISCFLAFPLAFTFERPSTGGVFGAMFDALMGFDKPFNQAPSLHIVLLVVIWARFVKHAPRALRWVMDAWMILIALSILTTYQHHFIDLPTGWLVGCLCVWMFPDERAAVFARARLTADPRRRALALRYAIGALAFAAAGFAIGGIALWLLWVALSLALVAIVYLALDPQAFEKDVGGHMTAASWWLFGPYFIGAWINSRLWTRNDPAMSEISPGMWLGRAPTRAALDTHGIRAVVDLAAELPVFHEGRRYALVPMLDLVVPPTEAIDAAVRAIDAARAEGPVLVCCALGYSRSALACAAWLVASGRAADADAAIAMMARTRPALVLGPEHRARLARS